MYSIRHVHNLATRPRIISSRGACLDCFCVAAPVAYHRRRNGGAIGTSAPTNFEIWGLSPPQSFGRVYLNTQMYRAGFIRGHIITGVFDPCACTHEGYAWVKLQEKHASECTKTDHPKSKTYFFWGSIPLNRTALAHTAVQ